MHQHRAGDAAPAHRTAIVVERHIIAHDDHLDRDARRPGDLGGQAEIEPVAGIVFDDQQNAGGARHRADRCFHGVHAGRGEDGADYRSGEHALADIAGMGRFMARPTAGDDRHLAARGQGGIVAPQHDVFARDPGETRIGEEQAFDHLLDDHQRIVDQLFHERV